MRGFLPYLFAALALYYVAAVAVYAANHPRETSTEIFLHSGRALLFQP